MSYSLVESLQLARFEIKCQEMRKMKLFSCYFFYLKFFVGILMEFNQHFRLLIYIASSIYLKVRSKALVFDKFLYKLYLTLILM